MEANRQKRGWGLGDQRGVGSDPVEKEMATQGEKVWKKERKV